MHFYLVILLDAFCVYHIWKNRTENYWFYVVLLMPVVGALVYIATQVLKKDTLTELQDGLTQVVNPNLKIQKGTSKNLLFRVKVFR